MSWHCSQELGGGFSVDTYLAGLRSAQWRLRSTLESACSPDSETVSSRHSPSGMTLPPSMASRGEDSSTSSAEDSPAKISVWPGEEPASTERARGCGRTCTESFAKYDRDSHLWRIPLSLFPEDCTEYSGTWPRAGMMLRGWCWELLMSVLRTSENGYGFSPRTERHLIPTPTACNAPNAGSNTKGPKSLIDVAKTGWNPGEKWLTPVATDGLKSKFTQASLAKRYVKHPNGNLSEQMAFRQIFPTAVCRGIDGGKHSREMLEKIAKEDARGMLGGALNPMWVEWLMGWPLGWTDLSV